MQLFKRKESKEALLKTRNKIVEDIMAASLEGKEKSSSRMSGLDNLEFKNDFNPFYNTLKVS